MTVLAAVLEATALVRGALDRSGVASSVAALDRALAATGEALGSLVDDDADLRRTWHLVAVMTAVVRGMLADGLAHRPSAASAPSTTRTSSTGSRATAPRPRWPTSPSSAASTTSCSPRPARRDRAAA